MKTFKSNASTTNKGFVHNYSGIKEEVLTKKLHELLLLSDYKLIQGTDGNGVYEKGNRLLRILLGAFIKYFKFTIETQANNAEELQITLTKKTSGMSGGAIGMSQVKKEINRLSESLKTL